MKLIKNIYIFTTLTIQCPLPAKILNINIYYRLKYSNKTFESIRRLYAAKPVQILHERRFWGLETSIVYWTFSELDLYQLEPGFDRMAAKGGNRTVVVKAKQLGCHS